jgi:hypothetical protein
MSRTQKAPPENLYKPAVEEPVPTATSRPVLSTVLIVWSIANRAILRSVGVDELAWLLSSFALAHWGPRSKLDCRLAHPRPAQPLPRVWTGSRASSQRQADD